MRRHSVGRAGDVVGVVVEVELRDVIEAVNEHEGSLPRAELAKLAAHAPEGAGLTIDFEAAADGSGVVTLTCSAGKVFRLDVECVNMRLVDLTRPWAAGGQPQHFD